MWLLVFCAHMYHNNLGNASSLAELLLKQIVNHILQNAIHVKINAYTNMYKFT